jgi:hypothetical protein
MRRLYHHSALRESINSFGGAGGRTFFVNQARRTTEEPDPWVNPALRTVFFRSPSGIFQNALYE